MRKLIVGLAALSFTVVGVADASAGRDCKPKRHYKPKASYSHHKPRPRVHHRRAPVYAVRPAVWVVPQPVAIYVPPPGYYMAPGFYGSAAGRVLVLY